MTRFLFLVTLCLWAATSQGQPPAAEAELRARVGAYLDAFNAGDAESVAAHWSENADLIDESTGKRTIGRDALRASFVEFFAGAPGARLTGEVESVRFIRPDVAIVDGRVNLFLPETEPVPSAFTAVMVKGDGGWLIESSRERDLPTPPTSYDALRDLEWLVGTWEDESSEVSVRTTVRWTANRAFLLRSFEAAYPDGDSYSGTQIIGWDPRAKTYRTWTFDSDGSWGEGVVNRSGGELIVRLSQVGSDGSLTNATQVIQRVDDDTLRVEKISETRNGAPSAPGSPVTVVRVKEASVSSLQTEGVR